MDDAKMVRVGGWFFIAFAIIYTGMQIYLFLAYDYPTFLNGQDEQVLSTLVSQGKMLRTLLALNSLLPLLLVPAGVGAYYALRKNNEPSMRASLLFATLAIAGSCFTLMQWPAVYWAIGKFYSKFNPDQQMVASAVLAGFNAYFGILIGAFFTKINAIIWFLIISIAIFKARQFPNWLGYLGIILAAYMILALFIENLGVFPFIRPIFGVIPLEPIWMIAFGMTMAIYSEE